MRGHGRRMREGKPMLFRTGLTTKPRATPVQIIKRVPKRYTHKTDRTGRLPPLDDAAHNIVDADDQLGQSIVSNGLPLTKLHHAAFDAHLIGIDPDHRIHVSDRLLEIRDGSFL